MSLGNVSEELKWKEGRNMKKIVWLFGLLLFIVIGSACSDDRLKVVIDPGHGGVDEGQQVLAGNMKKILL